MTYIKRVIMTGFKSFGNRTVSVNLAKGFTCIVGPNGNGKSNVIDGLCFALGRMSKKTMRAKTLTDLIFAGSKNIKPAKKAEVEVVFDNSSHEFPYDSDEFSIARWVRQKGTSGYKINGKGSTRTAILNALAQANIDPDGSNQFVLQGKIVELTHMNTVARREYIEELIGLSKYDDMKAKTLKELEKADKDLSQFEAIFKEVSSQLKKVEKEKNDALRWRELDDNIRLDNAKLIALKIQQLRTEETEVQDELDATRLIIDEMEDKVATQKNKIDAEASNLKTLEDKISVKEEEKKEYDEKLTNLKSELSAKEATLEASKQRYTRLEENLQKLENLQEPLEEGQTYDNLIENTQIQIDEIEELITQTNNKIKETKSQEKAKEKEIHEINKIKAEINQEISNIKQDIKGLETETELLKENINKNENKIQKLEEELSQLKSEEQSTEEALREARKQAQEINSEIEKLRNDIEDQKSYQKELDAQIQALENQREKLNQEKTDILASISSNSTEITMLEERISELDEKKEDYREEYERLTKGQKVEDQIQILKENEANLREKVASFRQELQEIQDEQKNSQKELEELERQRHNKESERNNLEKRLSGIEVDLRNNKSDLKKSTRLVKEKELKKSNVQYELEQLRKEKENLENAISRIKEKINQFKQDREMLQRRIERKTKEQESTSQELQDIMDALIFITQNIDISTENIKSDMQNVTNVAVDESKEVFQNFIKDISDILQDIREISNFEEGNINDLAEQLKSATQIMEIFIENQDTPLAEMSDRVQESTDEALNESTQILDGFIQDFSDQFDNIRIALQAVAVADSSELYQSLDILNNNIQDENQELAKIDNKLTKIDTQIEQKEAIDAQYQREIDELQKSITSLNVKLERNQNELEDKQKRIETAEQEINQLAGQMEKIRLNSENYWDQNQNIQENIDVTSEKLDDTIKELNALADVKRLLDDIEQATEDQEQMRDEIEDKKENLNDLGLKQDEIESNIEEIIEKIKEIKEKRLSADNLRSDLQGNIDSKNEQLKEVAARIKDLENVQKLIDEIETLTQENKNSESKIEENHKVIDEKYAEIEGLDAKILEKNQNIADIQKLRESLEKEETTLRTTLKNHNDTKNQLERTLDKQNQMKNRAIEIEDLKQEIIDLENDIIDIEERINELNDELKEIEETRSEIIKNLDDLQNQKSESWQQQQALRDVLSDFNAELSKNKAKFSNLETRKIVIEEKIDELFEKSKDFGSLPPVTEDLTEEFLNKQIDNNNKEKKRLEPVNLKSIEEYDRVKERWDEIDMRRQSLQRERKAILDSLDRIELEKTRTFMKAFHEINRVFSSVFQKLSPGGSAKMILENPAHPFEDGINIEARPRGKKISSLTILSGGEKTLVALSFIFAIQDFYPAPFYIMDEIDAALDGPNVYRTSMIIKEYAQESQFLVISHREENIQNADRIYGVAMNNGITDIFTVNLEEEKEREDFGAPVEIDEESG